MFHMTFWGFAALALVALTVAYFTIPAFARTVNILLGRGNRKLTTASEREEAMLAEQEAKVTAASHKVSDIRGTLVTTQEDLTTAEKAVASATADVRLAKQLASSRVTPGIKAANEGITDADLATKVNDAVKLDATVLTEAKKLQLAMAKRDSLKTSVDEMSATLKQTQGALETAKDQLQELANTAQSDAVREKANAVFTSATSTLETLKGVNGVNSAFQKEHDRAREEHNQAKARFEDAQGSQEERDFQQAKKAAGLGNLIDNV